MEGSRGWTVWPSWKEYVQKPKKLNIQLCFDLVLNHVGVNSAMTRAPDWIVPDQNQADGLSEPVLVQSRVAYLGRPRLGQLRASFGSDPFGNLVYMTDYALFWAKYANDTGGFVRFDNLHSSDPDFVQSLTAALRASIRRWAFLQSISRTKAPCFALDPSGD